MELKSVFIHHVLFWLKNPDSQTDKALLIAGLQRLSTLATIQQFQIGQPADTFRDVVERTYSISWLLIFANAADHESYQSDPLHLNFIENCGHLWSHVRVHDTIDIR